jgi:hypothetical protein
MTRRIAHRGQQEQQADAGEHDQARRERPAVEPDLPETPQQGCDEDAAVHDERYATPQREQHTRNRNGCACQHVVNAATVPDQHDAADEQAHSQ